MGYLGDVTVLSGFFSSEKVVSFCNLYWCKLSEGDHSGVCVAVEFVAGVGIGGAAVLFAGARMMTVFFIGVEVAAVLFEVATVAVSDCQS